MAELQLERGGVVSSSQRWANEPRQFNFRNLLVLEDQRCPYMTGRWRNQVAHARLTSKSEGCARQEIAKNWGKCLIQQVRARNRTGRTFNNLTYILAVPRLLPMTSLGKGKGCEKPILCRRSLVDNMGHVFGLDISSAIIYHNSATKGHEEIIPYFGP